jgi:hypothetical protein
MLMQINEVECCAGPEGQSGMRGSGAEVSADHMNELDAFLFFLQNVEMEGVI